jgi:hypothetical protein
LFSNFDFFTDSDPTHGFVQYLNQTHAETQGLIKVRNDGSVIIGVDSTNIYNASTSVGRPSVRITSQKKYNHGLFLADIANMPGGVCGTWPALWTLGDGHGPTMAKSISVKELTTTLTTCLLCTSPDSAQLRVLARQEIFKRRIAHTM